jgi:hypothetical protein
VKDRFDDFGSYFQAFLVLTTGSTIGFTELEIAALVQQVGSEGNFAPEQTEQMRQLMRVFYNGYTFHPDATAAIYKAVAQRGLRCGIFASTDARQSSSN